MYIKDIIEFKEFLVEHSALDDYIRCCENYTSRHRSFGGFNVLEGDPGEFLNIAFHWESDPNLGQDGWERLNDLWLSNY